ncbi:RNA polymerase sigma factor [Nocardioides sp.]|uniref:RNA polymerase sigma factor n=1 Tax=Nocardioides sp. TaxID=35761 RepID=UPI0039E219DC
MKDALLKNRTDAGRPEELSPRADPAMDSGPDSGPDSELDLGPDSGLDSALALARDGEEHGFRQLWRALQPPLLRYLTVRGEEAPEDLASETWLQVVRDLPRFRGDAADFRAWLFTVARHRAIDAGRARSARPVTPMAEVHVNAVVPSAETQTLTNLSTQAALALVAQLPPGQAELVMLRVVGGLDVATVARLVGKRPGTVRVGVYRALKALAQSWEEER